MPPNQGRAGISKGHMYFTNATSSYLLESENTITNCRNTFKENKFSYRYPHDPILHIQQADAKYMIPFKLEDGEIEDKAAKERTRKKELIEEDVRRLEFLNVKKIEAMAKMRRCLSALSPNDYTRERALQSRELITSAKKMLADEGVSPTPFDEFNYPPRPKVHPRLTCQIAAMGFTSAVTAEAMQDIK